ncbi:hypothetical protein BS78_K319900 [Paspalum vaginatum]|uniref:Uncharacterized protein n=1 Tax=Paspalum vaginatum TaxID=158149 RepID=A0A9W7X9F2_9POAL|nr:hypothetical protein BS78_K319900 [Paspalum vaginatum]
MGRYRYDLSVVHLRVPPQTCRFDTPEPGLPPPHTSEAAQATLPLASHPRCAPARSAAAGKKCATRISSAAPVVRGERARIHFDNLIKRWRAAVLIQKYRSTLGVDLQLPCLIIN